MATVTRTTTWVDGNTLTASALNGEFNNLLNALALTNSDIASNAGIAGSKLANPLTGVTIGTGTVMGLGSDAQGDIYYNNGSNLARLAPGTSGQFLQTQGAAANPQWASLGNTIVGSSSGIKIQSGLLTFTGNGTNSITGTTSFTGAFSSSTNVGVVATNYAAYGSANAGFVVLTITAVTASNFSWNAISDPANNNKFTNGSTYAFYWMAIGPA